MSVTRIHKVCETCGSPTRDHRANRVKRFCSIKCREANVSKICDRCGQVFSWRAVATHCAQCVLRERFFAKVDRRGPVPECRPELGSCWIWLGSKNACGYGVCRGLRRSSALAHRVAFFLAEGRWPEPQALHHCDRPSCVRRSHLFEGTQAENIADMDAKGRRKWSSSLGEANPRAKIREHDVLSIRAAGATGETPRRIAGRFGLHEETVRSIIMRKTWKHV